jgi:hypothetical protein
MGLVEVVYEGHPETDIYVYAFSCMFFKQLVRTRTHGSVGKRHVSEPCVRRVQFPQVTTVIFLPV